MYTVSDFLIFVILSFDKYFKSEETIFCVHLWHQNNEIWNFNERKVIEVSNQHSNKIVPAFATY